jgi:hypothetical protein
VLVWVLGTGLTWAGGCVWLGEGCCAGDCPWVVLLLDWELGSALQGWA